MCSLPNAQSLVVRRGGDGGRARAREHDAHVIDLLPDDLERVDQRRTRDDRRAVLVIVEDRDAHRLPQRLLDHEAFRRLDVLEVDRADRWLEELAEPDDVGRILRVHLEVEHVEVGELLEEVSLALHDRLAGQRADVAEPEDGGAVRDDGDEVAARRVPVRVLRIPLDLEARLGDAGRIGEREVALVGEGLGGDDRDLAGSWGGVVVERVLAVHRTENSGSRCEGAPDEGPTLYPSPLSTLARLTDAAPKPPRRASATAPAADPPG